MITPLDGPSALPEGALHRTSIVGLRVGGPLLIDGHITRPLRLRSWPHARPRVTRVTPVRDYAMRNFPQRGLSFPTVRFGRNRVQRLVQMTRDWRVRLLVPVIAINIAAFGGLYWLMYRYAMANLVNTHKFGATMLLDQIELDLRDLQVAHNRSLLQSRLDAHASSNRLLAINVYSAAPGAYIASTQWAIALRPEVAVSRCGIPVVSSGS